MHHPELVPLRFCVQFQVWIMRLEVGGTTVYFALKVMCVSFGVVSAELLIQ